MEQIIKQFYKDLVKALPMDDAEFRSMLYSADLLPGNLKAVIQSKPTSADKAEYLLDHAIKKDATNFAKLLEVMESSDNHALKKLANNIQNEIDSLSHSTAATGAIDLPTSPDDKSLSLNYSQLFRQSKCVGAAYALLTSNLNTVLKKDNLPSLKKALIGALTVPGVKVGEQLNEGIKSAKTSDDLLSILQQSSSCNWLDTRLLEALACGSNQRTAYELIKAYEEFLHPKKFDKVLLYFSKSKVQKPYARKLSAKIGINPDKITVGALLKNCDDLEDVILNLGKGIVNIDHVEGCLEIICSIPAHCSFAAYRSSLYNRHKFHRICLSYLTCDIHPIVYDPWLFDLEEHSIKRKEAFHEHEVATQLSSILLENTPVDDIITVFRSHDLLKDDNLTAVTNAPSDYLKKMMLSRLFENVNLSFWSTICAVVNESEILQHLSDQLMKVLDQNLSVSMQSEEINTDTDIDENVEKPLVIEALCSTRTALTTSPDDSVMVSLTHSPLHKKTSSSFCQLNCLKPSTVDRVFQYTVKHVIELLNCCDPNLLIKWCEHLMASDTHKIKLFTANFMDQMKQLKSSKAILKMLSHYWAWSSYSILKALAQFSKLALDMLEEFDTRLNPITEYPITSYAVSMFPYDTSSYTVLTFECNHKPNHSLQLVYDMQSVITENCDITQHALLLLAVESNPKRLYWMIPKSVVTVVNTRVMECSQLLVSKGVMKIFIYPSTVHVLDSAKRVWPYLFLHKDAEYSSGNVQMEACISELQQEMERMSLSSQNTVSELQDESRRLKSTIRSKEEEIDKLQKESFEIEQLRKENSKLQEELDKAQRNKSTPNNPAERMAQKNLLLKKLEELNNDNEQLQKEISKLQEELDKERSEHQERVRHHSISEQEKSTLQKLHSKVSEDLTSVTEELQNTKVDLQKQAEQLTTKEQHLQTKEQEITELQRKLETLEMSNTQLNEQLNATSKNLDQALDSLKHHQQESETISSRATETQFQLQQERDQLNHLLQKSTIERDKLLEQLQEVYSEKEEIEQQFNEYEANAKEMISQLQKREHEYKHEKKTILQHQQESDQQLNETMQHEKALEGEMHKLRDHYTQVNNELKRTVDERDREIQELKDKMDQDHSDMDLMRNQLQQNIKDHKEAEEKFTQQSMKLKATIKDKNDEIDSLQDQLTSYGGNKLKPAPDLNASMGKGNIFDHKNTTTLLESGQFTHRDDRWSGNKKQHAPSVSSQANDEFSTYQPQTTPTRTNQQQQRRPVTMSHPLRSDSLLANENNRMYGAYGNPPPNDVAGGAGINSGLSPPDLSNNVKGSSYTDVHQLRQQPLNASIGGDNTFDHKNTTTLLESEEFNQSYRGYRSSYQQPASLSLQERDNTFSTYQRQTTVPLIDQKRRPVTMSHPPRSDPSLANVNNRMYGGYGNPSPNNAAVGVGINSGKRSAYTAVQQLQQQPDAIGQPKKPRGWKCSECRFLNDQFHRHCKTCSSPPPKGYKPFPD